MSDGKTKITVIVETTNTGFSAYASNFKGITTVGATMDEVKENVLECLQHQTEYMREQGDMAYPEDYELEYETGDFGAHSFIKKARELMEADFMQYPDYDPNIEIGLADALTVLLSEHFPDMDTAEIYDFLSDQLAVSPVDLEFVPIEKSEDTEK